jgi:peptidoglycan/xylan/chitin deacetylase (PgdA/CDA1 family)
MNPLTRLFSRLSVSSGYAAHCLRQRKEGRAPSLTILAYHRIGQSPVNTSAGAEMLDDKLISASQAGFTWQMEYLNRNFHIITADHLLTSAREGAPLPPNAALITFDDGYRDNFDLAFPILSARRIPAVVFLTTGLIGTTKRLWWDEIASLLVSTAAAAVSLPGAGSLRLQSAKDRNKTREILRRRFKTMSGSQQEAALRDLRKQLQPERQPETCERIFLNWEEIRAMQACQISFAAHTHTHPILTRIPLDEAEQEISRSRHIIEQETGCPVQFFAYPNGRSADFSAQTRELLIKLGFVSAVTLMPGSNSLKRQNIDWLSLRRVYIGSDDRSAFIAKVSGALDNLHALARPLSRRHQSARTGEPA